MATPRKKWSELSPAYRKRLEKAGISREQHHAARQRAGNWSKLSPSYRKQLEKAGVTKKAYEQGVSLKAARRHLTWKERAIRADILDSVPKFASLPDDIANDLGKKWIDGFMSKSRGPLEPVKITDWRYGRRDAPARVRYQTDEQRNARIEFLQFLDENPDLEEMGDENWKAYRDNYMASFTKQ